MHVQVDQPRTNHLAGAIDSLRVRGHFQPRTNSLNFAIGQQHISNFVAVIGWINYPPALQENITHRPAPYSQAGEMPSAMAFVFASSTDGPV